VLYATAGVHPHNARSCDQRTIATLRELLAHPEVVALGECGLDYNRNFSPRPVQDRWFEAQLELAVETQRPLFLHERDAHAPFLALLSKYRPRLKAAVVHCFTGTLEEARAYLDLDLHLGITGWINDDRRGQPLRQVVRQLPLDRLMLETDAPFLLPRDMLPRPKEGRNEPAYLPHVLRRVAEAMGKTAEEVAHETTQTARRFFALPPA
jgi:TatD DNase family protein